VPRLGFLAYHSRKRSGWGRYAHDEGMAGALYRDRPKPWLRPHVATTVLEPAAVLAPVKSVRPIAVQRVRGVVKEAARRALSG
jgi:hypothetical protein